MQDQTKNIYLDTSVKKDGISGMLSSVEHAGVVIQVIQEIRENKGNLSVLDLANVVGAVPHKLVQVTLKKKPHHVYSSHLLLQPQNVGVFWRNYI